MKKPCWEIQYTFFLFWKLSAIEWSYNCRGVLVCSPDHPPIQASASVPQFVRHLLDRPLFSWINLFWAHEYQMLSLFAPEKRLIKPKITFIPFSFHLLLDLELSVVQTYYSNLGLAWAATAAAAAAAAITSSLFVYSPAHSLTHKFVRKRFLSMICTRWFHTTDSALSWFH